MFYSQAKEWHIIFMEVPQQAKTRTALWPSNCTTRYLSKGYKHSDSMHPNVYSSIINENQSIERAQMSIGWWMDNEVVYMYIHNGILLHPKKNEILLFATTWVELESIMLSEISQRKTSTIWFHSYVELEKQNKWSRGKREREWEREREKPRNRLNYRE